MTASLRPGAFNPVSRRFHPVSRREPAQLGRSGQDRRWSRSNPAQRTGRPTVARSVAEHLVNQLVAAGVERIYGIVGDSLNPIVDAVRRTEGIEWVQVRHEEAAAFAAAAEAEVTGKLTACAGSCGPGNLHLINGLYDANRSGVPVLAIASHIPSEEIGTSFFQETHPDRLFNEASVYSEMISTAKQVPRVTRTAIQHALTAP